MSRNGWLPGSVDHKYYPSVPENTDVALIALIDRLRIVSKGSLARKRENELANISKSKSKSKNKSKNKSKSKSKGKSKSKSKSKR